MLSPVGKAAPLRQTEGSWWEVIAGMYSGTAEDVGDTRAVMSSVYSPAGLRSVGYKSSGKLATVRRQNMDYNHISQQEMKHFLQRTDGR